MAKEQIHLCFCNNCESILHDTNPQVDAPLYEVDTNLFPSLERGIGLDTKDINNSEWIYVCPVCKTDDYLQDEVDHLRLHLAQKKFGD